jgi:hypothetical protein
MRNLSGVCRNVHITALHSSTQEQLRRWHFRRPHPAQAIICIRPESNGPKTGLTSCHCTAKDVSGVTPDDNSGAELSKTSTEVNGIKRDDNKKKALGFNPSKDLDFAIIGWPKTGKRHRSDLSHVTS